MGRLRSAHAALRRAARSVMPGAFDRADVAPARSTHPSARTPDWSRERPRRLWDPERRLMQSIRGYQRWRATGGPLGAVLSRAWVVPYRFWSTVSGASIPLEADLGGGLVLLHGQGVVIHPKTRIGPNCLLAQQVTLGVNLDGKPPHVGGHVDIGPGAKILGGVVIGDHARVGANSVVLCDVPAGAVAVGIPARIVGPATPVRSPSADPGPRDDASKRPKPRVVSA